MRIGGNELVRAHARAAHVAAASASSTSTTPPTPPTPPTPTTPSDGPSPFARLLHGLGDEVDRGEHTMRRALGASGSDLGTGDLLALQAGVYRYGEAVDLSSKLVDHAASSVKTVIQGQ